MKHIVLKKNGICTNLITQTETIRLSSCWFDLVWRKKIASSNLTKLINFHWFQFYFPKNPHQTDPSYLPSPLV